MYIRFLVLVFLLLSNNSLHAQAISDLQDQLQTLQGLLNKLSNALKAQPTIPVTPVVPQPPVVPIIPPPTQTILIPEAIKNVLSKDELDEYLADPAFFSALLTLNADPDTFKKVIAYKISKGTWPLLGITPPPVAPEVPAGPPPPPPPPPPIGVPAKPKGLTQQEADVLTLEEKQKSDQYLLNIINAAGRKRTGSFSSLNKSLTDQLKRLSGASDFKYLQEYGPEQLIQTITQWIDTNLKKQNGESEGQFLGRAYQNLLRDTLQNEFANIIQDWLWLSIASESEQRKQILQNAEDIVINFVAAQRTPIDNPDQTQQHLSDDAFLASFNVNDIDSLIRFLNVLRIHPSYLKYTSLQEDIPSGPTQEVAVKPAQEKPIISLQELTKELEERKKKAAERAKQLIKPVIPTPVQVITGQFSQGIIQELEARRANPKTINAAGFTPEYLARYMFNPGRFDSVRDHFIRKILKQLVIIKPVAQPFVNYLEKVISEASSYNDIIDFVIALGNASAEGKLVSQSRIAWKKDGKTVFADVAIEPGKLDEIRAFIQTLITIINQKKFAPKALKNALNEEFIKGFKVIFGKELSDQAFKNLSELTIQPF